MADKLLAKAIAGVDEDRSDTIDVYNNGDMKRDFSYIDDIVQGIISSLEKPFDYEIFNLGNNNPMDLEYFITKDDIVKNLGGMPKIKVHCSILGIEALKKAIKNYLPLQPGDVPNTYADIDHSSELIDYSPKVSIEDGINRFILWYKEYYGLE